MYRLALIGFGQMGKLLAEMSGEAGFEVVAKIDPLLGTHICTRDMKQAQIAIEFTQPTAAVKNISDCLKLGIPVVTGTTGWYDQLDEISQLVNESNGALLWGSNFSLGMNIFYEILRYSARIMDKFKDYDVYGYELHHRYKKDSPSGTARHLAEIILQETAGKDQVVYKDLQRARGANELHFASVRGGEIPGEHRIGFDSSFDTIELRHTARSRRGLAAGALEAARWLTGRQGLYQFSDVIKTKLKESL